LHLQVRCRAQERQGRAQRPGASRVVALSLRYLATRGVSERKREAGAAPDVARVRAARAFEPPRARRGVDPGNARVLSSRFLRVPTRGDRAFPRQPPPPVVRMRLQASTRHRDKWTGRCFSNHERASWMCSPSEWFFFGTRHFLSRRPCRRSKSSPKITSLPTSP
jgi:hypothetical protein